MEEHIIETISKLKEFESQIEIQKLELNHVNEEILKIMNKYEIVQNRYKSQQEELSQNRNRLLILRLQLNLYKNKEEALQQFLERSNQEKYKSELLLEEKQNQVWKERDAFCAKVNNFLSNYGLPNKFDSLSDIWENYRQFKNTPETDEKNNSKTKGENDETQELIRQSEALNHILQDLQLENENCLRKRQKLEEEKDFLLNEENQGEEFIRLKEALRYSQEQTAKLKQEWNEILDEANNHQLIPEKLEVPKEKHVHKKKCVQFNENVNYIDYEDCVKKKLQENLKNLREQIILSEGKDKCATTLKEHFQSVQEKIKLSKFKF